MNGGSVDHYNDERLSYKVVCVIPTLFIMIAKNVCGTRSVIKLATSI
jgi:hypothetical protein